MQELEVEKQMSALLMILKEDEIEVTSDYEPDTVIQRVSSDTKTNSFLSKLLNVCTSLQMRILNGRALGDLSGTFTCW